MREQLHGLAYLLERKKCTVSEIEQAIRLYRYALGIKMVIVDYLQAVRADDDNEANNKVTETSQIVSRLKRAASDAGVALVLFSQYSRESYKGGQEPGLNACKYCGDIENESEVMVLMWRDPEGTLHAKIAKTKWSAAGNRRFIVPVDPRTGCHLPWEPDQMEVEE
jgi:replicative DNA helicase